MCDTRYAAGGYQHAACRILNVIAKCTETTLQALRPGASGKAQALAALQAFKQVLKDETSGIPLRECLPSASWATEKDFDLTSTKVFLTSHPFQRKFVDCLKQHVPTLRTPGGPPLWVVVHVMVKCIEGLYELWRVREMYTLTQVEHHRALTTKFSKAWGDSGWSPTRWIHWCLAHSTFFAEKWRNIFQFSSIPTQYGHGPYKRRLKKCFKGGCLVKASMSLRHMHHCMSMNALEQGLLGLEAAKASDSCGTGVPPYYWVLWIVDAHRLLRHHARDHAPVLGAQGRCQLWSPRMPPEADKREVLWVWSPS